MTSDISRMCTELGLPEAPLVNSGVGTALAFFHQTLRTDPFDWVDYFKGIDFHKRVARVQLSRGLQLSRHRSTRTARQKPFVYFTKPGTSQHRTGTSFPQSVFERFELTSPIPALTSSASGIQFGRPGSPESRMPRPGGGIQYIIKAGDMSRLTRVH